MAAYTNGELFWSADLEVVPMNILLDFVTFKWQTGAGEYARRVYYELMQKIEEEAIGGINLFALYDSSEGISYPDMQKGSEETKRVVYLDLNESRITELIEVNKIDLLFIACAQYFGKYGDLQNVKCRTVCVIHDLAYEEMFTNSMEYFFKLINPKYQLGKQGLSKLSYFKNTIKIARWFVEFRRRHTCENGLKLIGPAIGLAQNNRQVQIVTVSEYTKVSLQYNYGISEERVKVLFSPERVYSNPSLLIENETLSDLIDSGKKYYLMLGANRNTKNPHKAVRAFNRYAEINKDVYFVVIGYGECAFENMINLSYLNDSDLAHALQHCYALIYPTFIEGFGYPAIEAMHYGKPVLASNVTSLPEVLEDAPIYFSPLYETEIFNALTKITDENYQLYSCKSLQQYERVHKRQERDLNMLIDLILKD